ncbi:MAG: class I SAM-dependent methyltransferase [Synergistaceae bacterium]|nr:class I SAM-dependent methyltransferase [Synergistaceae bacterium]
MEDSTVVGSGLRANYDRDRLRWNQCYSSSINDTISHPSKFALSTAPELEAGRHILDIGCGNGRDSIYFLNRGLRVTGIDASDVAIASLKRITSGDSMAEFICGDFVNDSTVYSRKYDYAYSRFTLHAITPSQQDELLHSLTRILRPGGRFFIESRTLRDDLYGKGENVGSNAFIYDGHYRRFIDPKELAASMTRIGYKIISIREEKGFSKFGDFDSVLLRLIAEV